MFSVACSAGFASCKTFGKQPKPPCFGRSPNAGHQSLVSLHLCIDSHLCRCIVQRLCVAVFMHPCITTLCDRYRASLHVYERSVGFASLRNFGRSFYKASMPYPQVACSPTHQHTKSVTPLIEWGYTFWCRWRGSNPHGIATNGF